MTQKALIFDAGPIINFAMNGLLPEFKKLKEIFNGKFIITEEVKYEVVDRPIKIKRFELEALKIQELINDGTIEFPESLGIKKEEISKGTKELLDIANNTFFDKHKPIHLIDSGETASLVLSKKLREKNISNLLVIDERTTRMLCEKPQNLKKLLQKKLHTRVDLRKSNFEHFKHFKIVRSTELMFIAYKRDIFKIKNKQVLDAVLYALKFKGCAISKEEIQRIKKLG